MIEIKIRAIVGVMIFLGYCLLYIVRYNICVHIVEIVQIKYRGFPAADSTSVENKFTWLNYGIQRDLRDRSMVESIHWDDMKMARLFSAYHIGYCICFPIFHTVGDRLGPTWVVGISGLISGVLNCLTPACVYYNYWLVFTVRVVKGFCAGAMQPSMVQLLRHWVPPVERNYFMWSYCGFTTGTCFTFMTCAVIQYYSRWPLGFYIFGSLQVMWAVTWVLIVTDSPNKHSFISDAELEYLTNAIGTIFTIKVTNAHAPWNLILKSKSFWAVCCLNFGYAWMIIALCTHGTLYYTQVVKYTLHSAAAITGLPFFLRLVLGTIVIHAFHWYNNNPNIKRIKNIRKYMIVVAHIIPGLVVMSTWPLPVLPGPVLLTTAVALTAASMDLTFDICYEMSPMFVNPIYTVIKIIGNTPGIILAFLVGGVSQKYNNSPYAWKHIWCSHAAVLCLSGVVFLIWGETHIQSWNAVRRCRRPRAKPATSIMSNITEVDEEDCINRISIQKPLSLLSGAKKSSQNKEITQQNKY